MCNKNSLLFRRPHIARYWHPTKNKLLTPDNVSKGSGKKVWWICDKGHEYKMSINNRVRSTRLCPYCSNKRVHKGNSLFTLAPKIAEQWHPTKNRSTTPNEVHRSSNKTFWWLCEKGHEYKMKPVNKQTTSCPYCLGKRVCNDISLAFLKSEIAKQWHPLKNGTITPEKVTANSNKMAWWICPLGHEFKASINARKNTHSGCRKCFYEGHTSFNEQVVFYYLKKIFSNVYNRYEYKTKKGKILEFDVYIPSHSLAVEYDGYFHSTKKGYENDIQKNRLTKGENIFLIRIREKGLPLLINENGLVIELDNPEDYSQIKNIIIQVFNFISLNYKLDADVIKKHKELLIDIYADEIEIRSIYITTRKKKNLLTEFPTVVREWNYKKNKDLTPDLFYPKSQKKVWWQCENDITHEWRAPIANRTYNGYGCPYCTKQYVTKETCLAARYPNALKFWNFKLNEQQTPNNVFPGSKEKVWWTCKNNHDHLMAIKKK